MYKIVIVTNIITEERHVNLIDLTDAIFYAKATISQKINSHTTLTKVIVRLSDEKTPNIITVVKRDWAKFSDQYGYSIHTYKTPIT